MNSILAELGRAGVRHEAVEDAFALSSRIFKNFSFLFQDNESELRQLELVTSLFDHVAVECVNDIINLIDNDDAQCDANGGRAT